MTITAWMPDDNPLLHRRMGKLLEECGELVAVAARIKIQGIDAIDPASGLTNRERLTREVADVWAQMELTIQQGFIDGEVVYSRADKKLLEMEEWENIALLRQAATLRSNADGAPWKPSEHPNNPRGRNLNEQSR